MLDLDKIFGAHGFEWDSKTLRGKILVHPPTESCLSALNAAHEGYNDTDSFRFVKSLIAAICQLDSDNSGEYSDDRVSADQASSLPEDELNEFARKFLEENSYFKNYLKKRKYKKERNDAEKSEGETDCDFLKRVMHQYRVKQKEVAKKTFDDIKRKSLLSNSVYDRQIRAMQRTLDLLQPHLKIMDSIPRSALDYINEQNILQNTLISSYIDELERVQKVISANPFFDQLQGLGSTQAFLEDFRWRQHDLEMLSHEVLRSGELPLYPPEQRIIESLVPLEALYNTVPLNEHFLQRATGVGPRKTP